MSIKNRLFAARPLSHSAFGLLIADNSILLTVQHKKLPEAHAFRQFHFRLLFIQQFFQYLRYFRSWRLSSERFHRLTDQILNRLFLA